MDKPPNLPGPLSQFTMFPSVSGIRAASVSGFAGSDLTGYHRPRPENETALPLEQRPIASGRADRVWFFHARPVDCAGQADRSSRILALAIENRPLRRRATPPSRWEF